MAIKIQNSTIIDDGRNIVDAGIGTFTTRVDVGTGGSIFSADANVSNDNILSVKNTSLNPAFDITGTGSVGIGITNPSKSLHVDGTGLLVASGSTTLFSVESFTPNTNVFEVYDRENSIILGVSTNSIGIGSTNKLTITPQDNEHSIGVGGTERLKLTTTGIDVYDTFTVGVGTTNRVKFIPETTQLSVGIDTTNFLTLGTNTGTEDTFTIYDSTEGLTHFTITNAGNIGVGTANPTEKLHIEGGNVLVSNGSTTIFSVNQTGTNILSIEDASSNPAFEVTSSGSVGIGLSNPTGIFEIQQSGSQLFQVSNSGTSALSITDASSNPAFEVTSSGKIGVGITNPSANFEVVSAGSTVFSVTDTVGNYYLEIDTDKFVVNSSGNAGIGTTNPTSKLDVRGDISLVGVETYSTTIQSITVTADRYISFPDQTGVVALVQGINGAFQYNKDGYSAGANLGYGSTTGTFGYISNGGSITQSTNKSTGIALTASCGRITMNSENLSPGIAVTFTMTNSSISSNDLLILNHVSGGTAGSYALNAQCSSGSADINVTNVGLSTLGEAIVIGFAIIKTTI